MADAQTQTGSHGERGLTLALLIAVAALATYATRVGGHLVVARFRRLDPRVEAALDAVPVAVLTAIVAPALVPGDLLAGGWREVVALLAAALIGLKLSTAWVVGLGLAVLVLLRNVI